MIIDKNKYIVLKALSADPEKLFSFKSPIRHPLLITTKNKQEYHDDFLMCWKFIQDQNDKNIEIISKPFDKAINLCKNKILELCRDINFKGDSKRYGILIMIDGSSYIYNIPKSDTIQRQFVIYMTRTGEITTFYNRIGSHLRGSNECHVYPDNNFVLDIILSVFKMYINFKFYAKVELKQVENGEKSKRSNNEDLIINNAGFPVSILDSTWFTTIVRTEGFNVRGHFRLQPKKNEFGEWYKELIYINEFEKNGYTREAKINKDE